MPDSARIVATALRDPLRIVHDLGGSIAQLCSASGMAHATSVDICSSIPLRQFVRLNQIASAQLNAPHFGRIVGSKFDILNLGDIGRAALSAPTLGAALRLMERAFISVQDETELRLDVEDGIATLSYRILDPNIWPREQDAELTIGVFKTLVANVADPGWHPAEVSFEHPAQGADRRPAAEFGCPVVYEAPSNTFSFSARLLDRPMPTADAVRYQGLSNSLIRISRSIECGVPLAARVRRLVLLHLGSQAVDQTLIAQGLGLSRRSLRRHLADEHTSFGDILAQCREDRAKALLGRTRLSVSEIADRLGYSEISAFERAFRQRTGTTPTGYRALGSPGR